MQADEELLKPPDESCVPTRSEQIQAAIVHLTPWVNVVFIAGVFGLVAAVLFWTIWRHQAPWAGHAAKQVMAWQALSLVGYVLAAVVVTRLLQLPTLTSIYVIRTLLFAFALYATYGAYRSLRGDLFRYPVIGNLIRPPRPADRRPYW